MPGRSSEDRGEGGTVSVPTLPRSVHSGRGTPAQTSELPPSRRNGASREPGCALVAASARGDLSQDAIASYRKRRAEQAKNQSAHGARKRARQSAQGQKAKQKNTRPD